MTAKIEKVSYGWQTSYGLWSASFAEYSRLYPSPLSADLMNENPALHNVVREIWISPCDSKMSCSLLVVIKEIEVDFDKQAQQLWPCIFKTVPMSPAGSRLKTNYGTLRLTDLLTQTLFTRIE
jgi:hypothetical protein